MDRDQDRSLAGHVGCCPDHGLSLVSLRESPAWAVGGNVLTKPGRRARARGAAPSSSPLVGTQNSNRVSDSRPGPTAAPSEQRFCPCSCHSQARVAARGERKRTWGLCEALSLSPWVWEG